METLQCAGHLASWLGWTLDLELFLVTVCLSKVRRQWRVLFYDGVGERPGTWRVIRVFLGVVLH